MTTTINASCACGSFNLTVDFPNASLPYPRSLCLCTSCRQVSGSCGSSAITLPSDQPIDLSKCPFLKSYRTAPDWPRYFCGKCGAHLVCHGEKRGIWLLNTGVLDRTGELFKWEGCKWIEDTLDGGVSVWFNEIRDPDGQKRKLQRWMLTDKAGGVLVPENELLRLGDETLKEKEMEDRLQASCHCGGVKFYVTRPNKKSKEARSPFPDLMIPYHLHSSDNPENETWWLKGNNTKYLAGTCACVSCRKSLGYEIQTWAFIPGCNIFREDGKGVDEAHFEIGTLKRYESSKGVWREFCGSCGATVFWHCDWRPDLVDVSIGVFDPEEGARVEGWLEWWTGRCSFEELSVSKGLIASLEDGLKNWGERKGR